MRCAMDKRKKPGGARKTQRARPELSSKGASLLRLLSAGYA